MLKFKYAFEGLKSCFKDKSILTQLIIGFVVIVVSLLLQITKVDFCLIILCIGFVVSTEIINTCIERVCDLISKDYHSLIKYIKDLAAGAVLFNSFVALIIGITILLPYIVEVF